MPGQRIRLTWQHDPTRYAPPGYRETGVYHAFVPDRLADLRLVLDGPAAGAISDAERAIRELNQHSAGTLGPFARLLLRTEALASSRVDRGLVLRSRALAQAESSADVGVRVSVVPGEVLATADAVEGALSAASTNGALVVEDIVDIHRCLMAQLAHRQQAGVVRTVQGWIGGNDFNPCGADFVPAPPRYIESLLADVADAVNRTDLPPVVQAALVQAQFETIQPFEGGNGRTARVLAQVVLRRRGIAPGYVPPVSVIQAADRGAYHAGLDKFRFGDPAQWVADYAVAASRIARLAAQHLDAVCDLQRVWRRRLEACANPRADAAAWAVIEVLPARPVISTASAIAAIGRAKSTVHVAVRQLVEAGILLPLSRSRRNRQWEALGLLEQLDSLDAGLPPGVKPRRSWGSRARSSRRGLGATPLLRLGKD